MRSILRWLCWPILLPLAWAYRRTVLRRRVVVAITGSFGKTTTTRAIGAAFGVDVAPGENYRTALALAVLRAPAWGTPLTLEVGVSRSGQMKSYASMLRPDVAVLTSIGEEHLRAMGTIARTAFEKGRLVEALRPGGLVVVNGDDPRALALTERRRAGVHMLRVGCNEGNDYRAAELRLDWPHGTEFVLCGPGLRIRVRSQLLGRHQVVALLAAFAVARDAGVEPGTILDRLEAFTPTAGRLSRHFLRSGAWLLRDDVKGAPSTIEAALEVFREIPARRRFLVLTEIAEPSGSTKALYRALGRRLAGVSDRILFIGHKFDRIRAGTTQAGFDPARLTRHGSAAEIAAALEKELRAGDVVLIKGGRGRSGFGDIASLLLEVPRREPAGAAQGA